MAETQPPRPQPATVSQMGPSMRGQIWPTYPRQSTAPNVWSVVKFYTASLAAGADDNVLGQTATRIVKFDLPITVLGWNAGVTISDGSGFPAGWDPLSTFKVRFSTVGGENIVLEQVAASAVVGSGRLPGFSWGGGWPFGPGTQLICEITPNLAGLAEEVTLDIDLVFPCLQTRVGSSQAAQAIAGGEPQSGRPF